MSKPMKLFLQINKVDATQRLVFGTLTEEIVDKTGEVFDYETGKQAFIHWSNEAMERSQGKSKGNLRAMHGKIAAGKFTDIKFDDDAKRIDGVAKVSDDQEWEKVLDGTYTGFSIGGDYAKRWADLTDPNITRYTPDIHEVSLVDNPCVGTATFDVIKADGSQETRTFKTNPPAEKTVMTNPNDNTKPQDKDGVEQVWKASDGSTHATKSAALKHEELLKTQQATAPLTDAVAQLGETLKAAAASEDDDDAADKKKAAADAAAKKKKDDADAAEKGETDAIDEDNKSAREKIQDAPPHNTKAAGDKDDKKPYGDVDYADPGYQADKKKRYPVDTAAHIRAAWNYISKDKNAAKYSAEQVKSIKAKIVSAWKSKIDNDGPPAASDKVFQSEMLQKGMDAIARAACIIQELDWLQGCIEMEAEWEHDNSPQPADLDKIIATLCDWLRELVEEETRELTSPGMDGKSIKALALAKRGARPSADYMDIMAKAQEHAVEIQKCMKAMGYGDEDEKDGADKAIMSELQKMRDENASLTKFITEQADVVKGMGALVEQIANAPAARKGVLRAVNKTADGVATAHNESNQNVTDTTDTLQLIKEAHKNPVNFNK